MSGVTLSDDRLRRFLLGQLDESDRQEIERACLDPDDTAFSSVAAAEDELRTDYAQGLLSADDRARFAERYLATDDGRARQSFLTGLALLAQRQPVVDPAQTGIARLRTPTR